MLTVAENILLGAETMANPIFLDRAEAHRRIVELGKRFGFEIDPDVKVGSLSVGWQQRVEILKALYRQARILVLDEPTAVLTPQETKEIFLVLRRLAEDGHSIIFISHKLYEVLEIADRITVIRRGKVVGSRIPSETDEDDLAALMVGRNVQLVVDRGESHPGEPALVVSDLRVADDRGHEAVKGVTFEVRAGEILGVAGVAGNGQEELVEALTGLRSADQRARSSLAGRDVTGHGPRALQRAGMSFVPGDRHRFGLVLSFSAGRQPGPHPVRRSRPTHAACFATSAAIEDWAKRAIAEYDIRTPSADRAGRRPCPAATSRRPSSRGSSAGSSRPSSSTSRRAASTSAASSSSIARSSPSATQGAAILLVSAELDEVLELSDRIAVMYRGEIVALVDGPTAEREEIGLLMAAGRRSIPALEGEAPRQPTHGTRAGMRAHEHAPAALGSRRRSRSSRSSSPCCSVRSSSSLSSLATQGRSTCCCRSSRTRACCRVPRASRFIDVDRRRRSRSPFRSTRSGGRARADEHRSQPPPRWS